MRRSWQLRVRRRPSARETRQQRSLVRGTEPCATYPLTAADRFRLITLQILPLLLLLIVLYHYFFEDMTPFFQAKQ